MNIPKFARQAVPDQAQQRIPAYIKGMLGVGQAAESIKNFGFGTLLLLYYNQVLGLSGSYAGLAISIALMADAISDPAVGSWSDGVKTRWGRRHPFMLASVLPMGVTFFFLFTPPSGLSEFQLFLWFTTFCILTRTALTFFHVPYLSLGAEISQDYMERTNIVAIRTGCGFVASLVVIAVAWNFFFIATPETPNPQLTREPYLGYALFSSVVMMAMMVLSTWGTRSWIPRLAGSNQQARKFSLTRVYTDLSQAIQNRAFRAIFFGTLLFAIYLGTHSALSMHLKTFFFELDTIGIQYWQYGYIAGGVLGLPLVPLLTRWVDKRWTVIIGCLGGAAFSTGPVIFKLLGWLTSDPSILVPILTASATFATMFYVQAWVTVASMMGDIADEHELKQGSRQEGIYFGSQNFSLKCSTAVGSLAAGFALDIIRFPVNSTPGQVPEDVLWNFGLMYIGVLLVLIFATRVFWPYDLDNKRHAKIRTQLEEKHRLSKQISKSHTK